MAYNVNFKKGTAAQYTASTRDAHTFYFVDDKDLYLGAIKISNDADLQDALGRLATAEGNISSNDADILKLQQDLAALAGTGTGSIGDQINALKDLLQGQITEIDTKVTNETTRAEAAEAALSGKIDALDGRVGTLEGTSEQYGKDIAKNKEDIAKNAGDIAGLVESVAGLVQADTELDGKIEAVDDRIDALVGEDSDKTVREVAAEETAKIVAGADENYDTLKEIADFITTDITGTAGLVAKVDANEAGVASAKNRLDALEPRVEANEGDIETLQGDLEAVEGTVGTHTEQIAALQQADTDNLAAAKTYADGEVAKVNKAVTDGLADAATARQGLSDLIAANAQNIQKNADAISAINNADSGILAQAKAYSDGNLATAKAYTDEQLTAKLTWQSLASV